VKHGAKLNDVVAKDAKIKSTKVECAKTSGYTVKQCSIEGCTDRVVKGRVYMQKACPIDVA